MSYQRHTQKPTSKKLDFAKPINQDLSNKPNLKEYVKELNKDNQEHCQYQQTMTKPFAISKIKVSFDQQETKKIGWEKGFSSLAKADRRIKQLGAQNSKSCTLKNDALPIPQQKTLQIPYNKKVEQIMNKKPLRQRLSGILPLELQLPISYDHQQLIKRMQLIDRTIQFLGSHRNLKIFFFDTIKRSIFQSSSILIQMKIIQQLLFLDQHCYMLEWRMNDRIKRHDIKINLPQIDSMDLRKSEMRKKIIKYLIYKQGELLTQKKLNKIDNHKWHDLFDYKSVQMPMKSLPIHPNFASSDIRAFPDQQIQKIGNSTLKMVFQKKKQKSQIKSLSSASVADMIFSKTPASQITNQILSSIRQKQKINNQNLQKQRLQNQKIDKQAILKIFDQILMVYMCKNVSNMFKITLIQLLQQRLKLRDTLISQYLQKLLKLENMKCMKVIESSKKVQVIQIDKQRFRQGRKIVQASF